MKIVSAKEEFTSQLLHLLWEEYASRVAYARTYQNLLAEMGGTFVNDHLAFRSLALEANGTYLGIRNVQRIFDALEFSEKGQIDFHETHLLARYFQHPAPNFPRIFISELNVERLPSGISELIKVAVADYEVVLSDYDVGAIAAMKRGESVSRELLEKTFKFFTTIPWSPPTEAALKMINSESQYGAWVLLHGYSVNHFTGSVNAHGIARIGDIELLVEELKRRGVPMKSEIEGARGSKLRQTSTEAVRVPVKVKGADGRLKDIEWTYAYMEYA